MARRPARSSNGRPVAIEVGGALLAGALLLGAGAGVAHGKPAEGGTAGISPTAAPAPSSAARLAVTVVAAVDDPGLPATFEAIEFWNATLADAGLALRLGPVERAAAVVPAAQLAELSERLRSDAPALPDAVRALPADIVVVLSDGNFISYSTRAPDGRQHLVAIKHTRLDPLGRPNVLRNVVAHELGHALGLRHNADPATLMCGRPAPCRPQLYEAAVPSFFPLTGEDHAMLRERFPPDAARAGLPAGAATFAAAVGD